MAGGNRETLARAYRAAKVCDCGNKAGKSRRSGTQPNGVIQRRIDGPYGFVRFDDKTGAKSRHDHKRNPAK